MSECKYTEEEYAEMIQCYLICNEDLYLTQICYEKRYPGRKKLQIETLEEVVETYLEALESSNPVNPEEEVTQPLGKDNSIVQYFLNNPHATVKKAASIFSVKSSYIEKLLAKRKVEIEAQRNEDEEIIKEEQCLNDYLKQNWKTKQSTATKVNQERNNSVEETVIIDESDSEESNTETIIGNNKSINVVCNESIPSRTPDFAICNETSNSGMADSFTYSENTMNETSDISNYSETKHSETDDDVICCEMGYTKKRKKKYSNRSGTKKLRTSEKRKRKSTSQGPITLESTRIYNAIVYTTRLEEMSILHKKIKRLDNSLVIQKILSESRPKYNNRERKSNITVRKIMSFKLLKKKLKKFQKKETLIDLTEKVHTSDDEDLIITDVVYPKEIITLNAEDTENVDISKNVSVVIVINNLFSNLCDVYITDRKCNIIEYHCTKLNDKNINRFDPLKIRLLLNACCWYRRQHKVESIWPRNECSFSRFLTTTHKCPLDQCTCCCKPKEQTTNVTVCKPYDTDKLTDNFKTQSHEVNKSLILSASRYKKPDTNQNTYTCLNRKNGFKRIYLLETLQIDNFQTMIRNECFEIINNQDILRFHTDNHWRVSRQKCYQCLKITGLVSSAQLEKVSVCCKWKRDSFLFAEYKACKISANALKFLRKTLFPNICDQCKNKMISPEKNQTPNLIIDKPRIEHTRTSVKPTLLKIGDKSVAPDVALSSVKNLAYQILSELKMTQKTSPLETINPPSTVSLNVTCNEILGLDFEIDNVDYQTATNIVEKFRHMRFTVKEDLKLVASLNTPMEPTSNEEFQVIARIILNTQNCLKLVPLPPGSVIDLVAKIIDYQSYFKSNIKVNVGNDRGGQPFGTSNDIKTPSREAFLKVLAAFKNVNDKPNIKEHSNTHSFQNKNQLRESDNTIEIFNDFYNNQIIENKISEENKNQSNTETFTKQNQPAINKVEKTNQKGKYSSNNNFEMQGEVPVISSSNDHLHSAVLNIYDDQYASKPNIKEHSNTHSFQNKNQLRKSDNTIEIFDDSYNNQIIEKKILEENKNQSNTKTFTKQNQTAINKVEKTNQKGKYSSDNNFEMQREVPVISSSNDHLHSAVFNIYDDQHASKPNIKEHSNTHSFQNKNLLRESDNTIEIFDDSYNNQIIEKKILEENKNQSNTKTFTKQNQTAINKVEKTNQKGKYSSDNNFEMQGEVPVISSSNDHLHSAVFNIYDDQHASKLEPFDCFANVIDCSKKCYAESFKSYLKVETESNIAFPKISSIFSLQSLAKQTQIQTNEPIPSTSKDVSDTVVMPSPSNNDVNILNNLNANPIQQVMLYDPITKVSQLVYMTPIVNSLDEIIQTVKQNMNPIEPMALLEKNSNNAVLTPINQVRDGIMPVALQSVQDNCIKSKYRAPSQSFGPYNREVGGAMGGGGFVQENSIMPDILNDIPRNIEVRDVENCEIVVKSEVDDDVIVLDSD